MIPFKSMVQDAVALLQRQHPAAFSKVSAIHTPENGHFVIADTKIADIENLPNYLAIAGDDVPIYYRCTQRVLRQPEPVVAHCHPYNSIDHRKTCIWFHRGTLAQIVASISQAANLPAEMTSVLVESLAAAKVGDTIRFSELGPLTDGGFLFVTTSDREETLIRWQVEQVRKFSFDRTNYSVCDAQPKDLVWTPDLPKPNA
jgi:hypothetical protein